MYHSQPSIANGTIGNHSFMAFVIPKVHAWIIHHFGDFVEMSLRISNHLETIKFFLRNFSIGIIRKLVIKFGKNCVDDKSWLFYRWSIRHLNDIYYFEIHPKNICWTLSGWPHFFPIVQIKRMLQVRWDHFWHKSSVFAEQELKKKFVQFS